MVRNDHGVRRTGGRHADEPAPRSGRIQSPGPESMLTPSRILESDSDEPRRSGSKHRDEAKRVESL